MSSENNFDRLFNKKRYPVKLIKNIFHAFNICLEETNDLDFLKEYDHGFSLKCTKCNKLISNKYIDNLNGLVEKYDSSQIASSVYMCDIFATVDNRICTMLSEILCNFVDVHTDYTKIKNEDPK